MLFTNSPREGAINFFTNLNQSELRKLKYGCTPREGVTNLCTESSQSHSSKRYYGCSPREGALKLCKNENQSDLKYRTHCSGRFLEHSITSCNKTQSSPVSICNISKSSLPYCQCNSVISGSSSRKNISILDIWNAMNDPIMDENFRKLLNELLPLNRIPIGRSRPIRRQKAKRDQEECHQGKQVTSGEPNTPL